MVPARNGVRSVGKRKPRLHLARIDKSSALASSDVHRVDPRGASGLVGKADNRGVVLSAHFTLTDHVCRPLQYGADAFYEAMSSSPHGPPLRLFRGPPRLLRSAAVLTANERLCSRIVREALVTAHHIRK